MPIRVNFEGILNIVSCNFQLKLNSHSVGIESIIQMQKMKFQTVLRRFAPWQQILAVGSIFVYLLLKTATSSATTTSKQIGWGKISLPLQPMRRTPQMIAGADNFNPDLKLSPLREYIPPVSLPDRVAPLPGANSSSIESKITKSATVGAPLAVLEGIQPNIHNDWNNSGQVNRTIESTAIFRLNNGDRLLFTTGYDTYEQPGTKTVTNIPLGIEWETKINSLKVRPGVGVDISSGSTTPNFNLKVETPG